MKKLRLLCTSMLIAVLLLQHNVVFAAGIVLQETTLSDTPFAYHLRPGMGEWETVGPLARREACYVSEEMASNMTTRALVQTVLEYPFLVDIYAFGTVENGIQVVAQRFPAMLELLSRSDAMNRLDLHWQVTMAVESERNTQQARYAPVLLNAISEANRNGSNDMVAPQAYEPTQRSVRTPNNSSVSVWQYLDWRDHGADTEDIYDTIGDFLAAYPSAEEVTSHPADPSYNCHSYAWYSQSASNPYWMDNPTPYMTDGSYFEVDWDGDVDARVVYRRNGALSHSAIVYDPGDTIYDSIVIGKWEYYSVFTHELMDCPYYFGGSTIECWMITV